MRRSLPRYREGGPSGGHRDGLRALSSPADLLAINHPVQSCPADPIAGAGFVEADQPFEIIDGHAALNHLRDRL